MKMKIVLCVVLIVANCNWLALGQNTSNENDAQIESILKELVETSREKPLESESKTMTPPIPGLVAGYQKFGQPLQVASFGVRKWGDDSKVKADDLLHIGSCTKAMTATLIGRLVDQGKLSFDTTIKQGLPHLVEKIHPGYHDVTLHQLLTHTGGVPRDAFWSEYGDKPVDERRDLLIVDSLDDEPNKAAGSDFDYSNLGYCIAGRIAAYRESTTWEKLITRELFEPLGMKSAGFGPPGTTGKIDQPWGHLPMGENLIARQGDNPPPLGPAGTIHLTIEDWAKFAFVHAGCREDFLKDKTLTRLHETQQIGDKASPYACGWIVANRPWAKGKALTHNGSNTMWYATVWIAPETDTVFMAAANAGIHPNNIQSVDQAISGMIQAAEKE